MPNGSKINTFRIWGYFFLYALAISLFIQCLAIPKLFPKLDGGYGLLAGTDSITFHRQASQMAEQINNVGWSAWDCQPNGNNSVPTCIGAALYALIYPRPVTILPWNALFHSTTAILLFLVFLQVGIGRKSAIFGALTLLVFPSSLSWVAQFGREIYVLLGFMLLLHGWSSVPKIVAASKYRVSLFFLEMGLGSYSLYIGRTPFANLIMGLSILYALFLLLVELPKIFISKQKGPLKVWAVTIVGIAILVGVNRASDQVLTKYLHYPVPPTPKTMESNWQYSKGIPRKLDNFLKNIAERRRSFTNYGENASTLDAEIPLNSASGFLFYIPRALTTALLAPYPSLWFSKGNTNGGTMMRMMVAPEMILIYLGLILLGLYLLRNPINRVTLTILYFCLAPILSLGIGVCNMGALHRYRYGFIMPLVGLGYAYLLEIKWKNVFKILHMQPDMKIPIITEPMGK